MKTLGIVLAALGAVIMMAGFGMDGSVDSGVSGRVMNIGLLNEKMMLVMVGGAAFVGGVVLVAAGEIVSALAHAGGAISAVAPARSRQEAQTAGHSLAPATVPKAAPEHRKRTGYGYCMNCAAIRSYDAPKCGGCGSTGPVIGDAPAPVSAADAGKLR